MELHRKIHMTRTDRAVHGKKRRDPRDPYSRDSKKGDDREPGDPWGFQKGNDREPRDP